MKTLVAALRIPLCFAVAAQQFFLRPWPGKIDGCDEAGNCGRATISCLPGRCHILEQGGKRRHGVVQPYVNGMDGNAYGPTDPDQFSGSFVNHSKEWRGRRDSNPRPLP
jgi:hypothetical protein